MDREPVQLFKQRSSWSAGIGLKDNASEGILDLLEFQDDRVRCAIKD